jgi:hypothetical protein
VPFALGFTRGNLGEGAVRESPRHSRGLGWHAPVSGR